MHKLNGYWYTHDEVVNALQKKGYRIILIKHDPGKDGMCQKDWHAVKEGEEPTPLNYLKSIAVKEFHKRPELV